MRHLFVIPASENIDLVVSHGVHIGTIEDQLQAAERGHLILPTWRVGILPKVRVGKWKTLFFLRDGKWPTFFFQRDGKLPTIFFFFLEKQ